MANFNSEFKKILKNLETNIKDEKSLEAAKIEIFNLYNLFFDEFTNLEQTMNSRMAQIAQSQLNVVEKLEKMESKNKD